MLFEIRDYIFREKIVSLKQLGRAFNSDAEALLPMLDIWIKKGQIAKEKKPCGKPCQGCSSQNSLFFSTC